MEKRFKISVVRKMVLLILGVTILCYAVSPKLSHGKPVENEKHTKEVQDQDTGREVHEYFVSYEAIVPATQLHLSIDPVVVFKLFVLEENIPEPAVEKPFIIDVFRKILFSCIITPNAP